MPSTGKTSQAPPSAPQKFLPGGGSGAQQRAVVEKTSEALTKDQDGTAAQKVAAYLTPEATTNPDTIVESSTEDADPTPVADGWYLLTAPGRRPLVAWVAGEAVTLQDKADVPIITKEVATGLSPPDSAWSNATTYGAGEPLAFRLTYTVPQSFAGYTTYKTVIHDSWESVANAFQLVDGSIAVELIHTDGTQATTTSLADAATITTSATGLTVAFENLSATAAQAADQIQVTYRLAPSTTENAGAKGLLNSAWATFPRFDGEGKTTEVTTRVYTFSVVVRKSSATTAQPLAGARFALQNAAGSWLAEDGTFGEGSSRTTFTTNAQGQAQIAASLNAGTYTLVELEAPSGYVLPANPETSLTITAAPELDGIQMGATAEGQATLAAIDFSATTVTLDVTNEQKPEEPSEKPEEPGEEPNNPTVWQRLSQTGDYLLNHPLLMGLCVAGAAAIVLAVVLRRRRDAEDDDKKPVD